MPGMPVSLNDHPASRLQNSWPRSPSAAGNSTCTIFLPIPFLLSRPERRSYTLVLFRRRGIRMVRAFVVYEGEVDEIRFARHAELCRKVEGGVFRHGRVFGAPMGEPRFKHYAEWEFPDREAFDAAARTPEFMDTG